MSTKIKKTLNEANFSELDELNYEYEQAMVLAGKLPQYSVTFYGGARLEEETQCYKDILLISSEFGKRGWGIITGGGPGVMQAGLQGAKNTGAIGAGFRLRLKGEEPEVIGELDHMFEHFPPRKYALRQSDVFVYCPGSVGTLDELMENLDLMKTSKMPIKPIYLYDSSYWSGLVKWIEETIIKEWRLGGEDLKKLYKMVDNPTDIINDIF